MFWVFVFVQVEVIDCLEGVVEDIYIQIIIVIIIEEIGVGREIFIVQVISCFLFSKLKIVLIDVQFVFFIIIGYIV